MAFNGGQRRGGQRGPSDVLGDFARTAPTIPYRRIAIWGSIIGGVIFAIVMLNLAKNLYTDWLWFDSLGYSDVFVKRLVTRTWLFFAGASLFAVIFLLNIAIALRFARRGEPALLPPETIVLVRGLTRVGIVLVAGLFAIIFGAVASGQWENLLRIANAENFVDSAGLSIADPQWGHNPSFYVFILPLLRFVQTWTMGLVLMLIVGAASIYGVSFSLRGFRFDFGRPVKLHLGILFALLMVTIGISYWFDINELVLSDGEVFGAGAADVAARLFSLRFMMAIAALVAILAIVSAYMRDYKLPAAAFGLWALSAIFILGIYPAAYQRFSVQPSELSRETPYIERNIELTRGAFGLDNVEVRPFRLGDELTAEDIDANPGTIDNIRLWDHRPLKDTYNQIQFLRPYYTFVDVDVDRYVIDGKIEQVMLAARELAPENLPGDAQKWVAQRLQYTHGYGLAMSPVTEFTLEGRPEFFVKDVPPKGLLPVDQPSIYYGERSRSYVIVNTKEEEFDFPLEQGSAFTTYDGAGGVRLDNIIKKVAFAWRFGDFNILISGQLTSDSRILYFRQVQDRVSRLAPFLSLDSDPYLVVADGKLWWIQDAYTTTSRFPYSQRYRGEFNYIRNSVKVVVDAFNGTTDFYVIDPNDAIVRTYSNIYPDLFKPISDMPQSLRDHIRYPEGLFNVQEEMFRTYHVTDPRIFFTREDIWSRPSEVFYENQQPMEAYYIIMPLPGETKEEFLLMVPFTPFQKPNMVAWLVARSDGDHYGELVAFTFPKDRTVDGPLQVEARIDNDPLISQQFTLWGQQGSTIIRGNLLVIPMATSILYIEPIYLQARQLNFPELKRVVVVMGSGRPVMETTLRRSLEVALGQRVPSEIPGGFPVAQPPADEPAPATPVPTGPPPATPAPGDVNIDDLVDQVEQLLEQLQRLRDQQR